MHEVGIAASILGSVEAEVRRRPEAHFQAVGVRIGELANVDKEALAFAFEALTRNTDLANLRLDVEWCLRRQRCLDCGAEFVVQKLNLSCETCGSPKTSCIGGTELDVAYLELEEPCVKL